MKVVLKRGEKLTVELEDADGSFEFQYSLSHVRVHADFADDTGREGLIYNHDYRIVVSPGQLIEEEGERAEQRALPVDEEVVIGHIGETRSKKKPASKPRKKSPPPALLPKDTLVKIPDTYPKLQFAGRQLFLENLAKVEASPLLRRVSVKGIDECHMCDEDNPVDLGTGGALLRSDNGVRWPKALRHHVEKHGFRPEQWFINYIANKAEN